ncbi:MAG: MFS transporter [Steroidobacteraceae bacterium]
MHVKGLSAADRRTLFLASLGGALEFYDFIIFVFFATTIGALFFPPDIPEWLRQMQTFGIFAAGYLARPIGGVLMAHFGDRMGRKQMFMLSVLLMAVPTLLIGSLPTYASVGLAAPVLLLALRILQGAAVGGEVPGAWVFVSEHVPEGRVGLACGILTAGLTVGILLGSLVAGAVHALWTAEQVLSGYWRVPFVLGGLFGLLALWLRRYLHETPVFRELQQRRALVAGLPIGRVLAGHRVSVVRSMIYSWLLTAGIVIVILMTPTLAQTVSGIPAATALHANSWATLGLAASCILHGLAADRFGARRVLIAGAALMVVAALLLFYVMTDAPQHFTAVYALAGLCIGVVGVVPVLLVRGFPAEIRYSGISFSYNVAYAISGGFTPLIVTLWMRSNPHAPAYYIGVVALAAALTVASQSIAPAEPLTVSQS